MLLAFAQVRYPVGRFPNLFGWLLRANWLDQSSKVASMYAKSREKAVRIRPSLALGYLVVR